MNYINCSIVTKINNEYAVIGRISNGYENNGLLHIGGKTHQIYDITVCECCSRKAIIIEDLHVAEKLCSTFTTNIKINSHKAEKIHKDNELGFRKLLWLRHGCNYEYLYGDDGEMQCTRCKIDFRRSSASDIEQRLFEINKEKVADTLEKNGAFFVINKIK